MSIDATPGNLDRGTFITALRAAVGNEDAELEDALWGQTDSAALAHPAIGVKPRAWAAALARARASAGDTSTTITSLRAADLWLATALGCGDERALETFEALLMPEVERALRRFKLSDDEHSELRQRVRIRLLVSEKPPTPPRIATYEGLGSLAAWVRTISARLALNLRRDQRAHAPLEEVPEFALPGTPEVASLRAEHRNLFVGSLKQAFRELEAHDRTLLRLRYAQNMTAVSLSRLYGVHESTLSRRLASARNTMAENFQRIAAQRLGVHATGDVLGLLQSRVETSLESLLSSREST